MAKQLTDNELAEVLASERLVVIDFWAEWCGPCKKISPIVDELATEYEGKVDIYKCDVDENSEVCEKFGIRNIPTLIFLKNGEVVDRHVGTATKSQLAEKIDSHNN
ncbi:MAG TPA: thioredoxin [Candidatus Limisoma gallistercoris]|nr:thioredoxin [Candidatus Limisoma gallistercoris]